MNGTLETARRLQIVNHLGRFISRCAFVLAVALFFQALALASSSVIDVLNYDAMIEPDLKERSIKGEVQIRFANRGADNLAEVPFDAEELQIEDVSENGSPLKFRQEQGQLIISLTRGLKAGEIRTLKIHYHAKPTRGLKFYEDHLYAAYSTPRWLVCNFNPGDKATLRLRLTVPDSFKVVANGRLMAKEKVEGDELLTLGTKMRPSLLSSMASLPESFKRW